MSYIYALYFIEQKAVKIGKADDLLSVTKDITKSSFAIAGLGDPDRLANDAERITELMKAANRW